MMLRAVRLGLVGVALAMLSFPARPAAAFSLLHDPGGPVEEALGLAARWSAASYLGSGLHDGLQVAIDGSVASGLEVTPEEIPILHGAIANAFGMWESDALRFEIAYDAPDAQRGTRLGHEIDVFAVPGDDPIWDDNSYFGVAYVSWDYVAGRTLTNGSVLPGYAIVGSDIFLNTTSLLAIRNDFGLPLSLAALALTRLLGHEIGHALGLGHPNEAERHYDFDDDPLDDETVDPLDPFAGLALSGSFDTAAILSNRPCGPDVTQLCGALLFQDLRPDDRLGRDVLYPVVPEPATAASLGLGLAGLGLAARRAGRGARTERGR